MDDKKSAVKHCWHDAVMEYCLGVPLRMPYRVCCLCRVALEREQMRNGHVSPAQLLFAPVCIGRDEHGDRMIPPPWDPIVVTDFGDPRIVSAVASICYRCGKPDVLSRDPGLENGSFFCIYCANNIRKPAISL